VALSKKTRNHNHGKKISQNFTDYTYRQDLAGSTQCTAIDRTLGKGQPPKDRAKIARRLAELKGRPGYTEPAVEVSEEPTPAE